MSKLDEVIKELEFVVGTSIPVTYSGLFGTLHTKESVFTEDIEEAISALRELNKPVLYTVEIKRKEGEPGIFFYEATCNNKRPIGRSNTVELIKEYVFAQLNIMAEILSMPTIVINQIKFLEL